MSYYLTISIFPLLIVVYAILNSLNISNENLYKICGGQVIPADVIKGHPRIYQRYIGGTKSTAMLFVGITVMLTSSSSAFGSMIRIMADIQGKSRFRGFWARVSGIVISVGLLVIMYVSAPRDRLGRMAS